MLISILFEEQRGNGALDMSSCLEERNFLKRARSLLVVVASPPSPDKYEVFTKKVLEFTSKDPFRFSTPNVFKNVSYVKVNYFITITYNINHFVIIILYFIEITIAVCFHLRCLFI